MTRCQAWSTGEKLAQLSQSNQALVADWWAGADNPNKLLCDRPTDQWTKRWLLELRVLDFKIWIWPHDRLSDYHHWLLKSVQLSPALIPMDAKGLINFICYRQFLVACYATLHPAMSVGRSVGRLVGPHFTFSAFLSVLSSLLLPKCPSALLQHCPCPPARD